jgi:hypothetical protein
MASSSGILYFGDAGKGDQEDDPEMQRLKRAFAPIGGGGSSASAKPSNVIVFPQINRQFQNDVEQAVTDNIPIYQDNGAVRRVAASGELDEMRRKHEEAERRQAVMRKDPIYRFALVLQGLVGTQMAGKVANMGLEEMGGNVQIVVSDAAGAAAAAPVLDVGQFSVNELGEPQRRRLQQLRDIDSLMGTAAVSGKTILTPLTESKIGEALASLRESDYDKFYQKKKEHFMGSEETIHMFAQLVALKFEEGMIKHSSRYQGEVVLPRERQDIKDKCYAIKTQLVFDTPTNVFRMRTPHERLEMTREVFNQRRRMKTDMQNRFY